MPKVKNPINFEYQINNKRTETYSNTEKFFNI